MLIIKYNFLKLPKIFFFLIFLVFSIIFNIYEKKILFFFFTLLILIFLINSIYKKNILNIFSFLILIFFNFYLYKTINLFKNEIYLDFKVLNYFNGIFGIILKKDFKENKYIYTIQVKNKLLKNKNLVKIISKNNIDLMSFVKIENIYWINNEINNKDEFFKNFLKTRVSKIGISKNIKVYNEEEKFLLKKIINFFENFKIKILHQFEKNFENCEKELINAIFLGKNEINNLENYLKFKEWGTIHHLVRAGLHANIIYSSIITIFCFLISNFYLSNLLSVIFLIFFYLITFSSLPFQRAMIMFLFYFFCKIRNIITTPLHVFSFCSILFLFHDPFIIADLSFQLSFFATGVFALLNYSKNYF